MDIKNRILKFFSKRSFGSVYLRVFFLIILLSFKIYYESFIESRYLFIKLADIIFYYILLNLFFNMARLSIIYLYLRKNKFANDYYDNFTLGINRISFFLNHFIFGLIFINTFIINLKELLTAISLIAVAFVLIFKEYISNFMNGILIMFSEEIRLKDYIKIGEFKGRVTNLTFKNVELKTDAGDYVYVPNNLIMSREVINYSKGSLKNIRFDMILNVNKYSNYNKIKEKILTQIYSKYSDIISNQSSIKMKIDRIEMDNFTVSFDISLTKYSYKSEETIKNFICEKLLEIKKDK